MAAALVSIVPVLIIFAIGQRYFVQGVVASGLKG
jgi:multiple sugar transport system permease protein